MITVHKKPKNKPYPKSKLISDKEYYDMTILESVGIISEMTTNMIWVLSNGEKVLIRDLRLSHIKNILVFMQDRPYWRQEQKPLLLAELDRRKKKKLIDKTEAGALLYANS